MINNDPDIETRRAAWLSHVPSEVRFLLIAEAPPAEERYFYYEQSDSHDHLFINTMRAVFRDLEEVDAKVLRKNKKELLQRFKESGFLIIDAIEYRISSTMPERQRVQIIEQEIPNLKSRIAKLNGEPFSYAIKKSVFTALNSADTSGLGIMYRHFIPFPSNGHQIEFRDKLRKGLSASRFTWRSGDVKIIRKDQAN